MKTVRNIFLSFMCGHCLFDRGFGGQGCGEHIESETAEHHRHLVLYGQRRSGKAEKEGREASPMPANWNRDEYGAQVRARLGGRDTIPAPSGYQLFAPVIDTFLKEHLFADIFARDNLDHQSRELATISTLASIPGLGGQLQFHMNAAMNTGLNEAQMKNFISVLAECVGTNEAQAANTVLTRVLASRTK